MRLSIRLHAIPPAATTQMPKANQVMCTTSVTLY
jgi:hypothetical protein